MAYVELDYIQRVLRDDLITYPADLTDYVQFAETEINSHLVARYAIPFDDLTKYSEVPALIKWIAAYLVGFKLYDEKTATSNIEGSRGDKWWAMAQAWLIGLKDGTYDLILEDGTIVEDGSTTGPRAYPTGPRDKAPSSDNVPYFSRSQAGEW
jgi:hypothetical protein